MSQQSESLELLKASWTALPVQDQAFAQSLLASHAKKQSLTEKQWIWVEKLAHAAIGVPEVKFEVQLPLVAGILALFKTAVAALKYPALTLSLPGGRTIALKLAGAKSQTPGSIAVVERTDFLGRVSKEGAWQPRPTLDAVTTAQVSKLLCDLAIDPAGTAAAYGKMTGLCCFCGTALSADNSTQVGYGPVCAKRWGLPWGKV